MTTRHKNPQYNLRMPSDLKEGLKAEADKRGVSMNAEILLRLEESLRSMNYHSGELQSAEELRAASQSALKDLRSALWAYAIDKILGSAEAGMESCPLNASDVPGSNPDDEGHAELARDLVDRLEQKGYVTDHSEVGEIVFWGGDNGIHLKKPLPKPFGLP